MIPDIDIRTYLTHNSKWSRVPAANSTGLLAYLCAPEMVAGFAQEAEAQNHLAEAVWQYPEDRRSSHRSPSRRSGEVVATRCFGSAARESKHRIDEGMPVLSRRFDWLLWCSGTHNNAFNTFNATQFGYANARIGNTAVGTISSTSVDPRAIQLALKLGPPHPRRCCPGT